MAAGDPLPSVRELAAEYGTSTTTVSKATQRLLKVGKLVSRPGWGVFKANGDGSPEPA